MAPKVEEGHAMTTDSSPPYEPGILRVLQSKEVTRAYYNKIAKV